MTITDVGDDPVVDPSPDEPDAAEVSDEVVDDGSTTPAPVPERSRTAVRAAIGVALALLAVVTVAFAFTTDAGPDEGNHVQMVDHHAHNLRLLTWEETQYRQMRGHPYYLYSPVAYYAYVPFLWVQDAVGTSPGKETSRTLTRLGGLLYTGALFFVLLALARRVAPRLDPLQHVALAFVVCLIPEVRYLDSIVTSDAMTVLAGALCFAVAARLLDRGEVGYGDAALVGLSLASAVHSRYNALPAAAVVALTFVWCVRRTPTWRERIRRAMVATGIPLGLAGAFYISVYHVLGNGHLLATSDADQLLRSTFDGDLPAALAMSDLVADNTGRIPNVWMGAWYQILQTDKPPDWVGILLAVLVVVGLVVVVARGRALLGRTGQVLGVAGVLTVLATWALMLTWPYQIGRFLLPSMVPALVVLIAASAAAAGRLLPDRLRRIGGAPTLVIALWGLVLVGIDVYALTQTVPGTA